MKRTPIKWPAADPNEKVYWRSVDQLAETPEFREFLNRVYANAWTQLAPGKCRYGLMLDENGMVFDDGVTRYLVVCGARGDS